jgi:hypothetical protein
MMKMIKFSTATLEAAVQDLANLLRHDLPAQAKLVRQLAAGHWLATVKQLVPVAVDLGLVLAMIAHEAISKNAKASLRGVVLEAIEVGTTAGIGEEHTLLVNATLRDVGSDRPSRSPAANR